MENEILFSEQQRFKQWWVWLILLGVNGLLLFGVYKQIIGRQPYGDNPMSDTGLLITTGIIILSTLSFYWLRLDTQIKMDGIYVRFIPFRLSFRHYSWEQIQKAYVRQYQPILEYGGWGIRGFGRNRALNVSGNQGLQLQFTDDKKLLIGTNKPVEINEILVKLGKMQQ